MFQALYIASFVLASLIILIILAEIISYAAYRRSASSTLAEMYLKVKGKNHDLAYAEKELEEIEKSEEKPYVLPQADKLKTAVKESLFKGMQVFTFNPEGAGRVVLYLHGGGYVHEPLPFHIRFIDNLAKLSDCRIVMPVHPKAPKHTFEETYALLTDLYKRITESEVVSVLMGDSSGGGLALGLCEYFAAVGLPIPESLILLAPWSDLTMSNPQIPEYEKVDPRNKREVALLWASRWADGTDLKDYRLSPVYGDPEGIKNVTIFAGTHDALFPDCVELHKKLSESGVKCELVVGKGLNHVYPVYPTSEGKRATKRIAEMLKEENLPSTATV